MTGVLILKPADVPRVVRAPLEHRVLHTAAGSSGLTMQSGTSEQVLQAMRDVSCLLTERGVRHAVIGGIAVGAYGWPRATRDVDLLIGDEAWERQPSGEMRVRVALPEFVNDVPIDYLPIDVAGEFLAQAFERPRWLQGVPFAPVEILVCTKLIRLAMRDQADIVEIVKAQMIDRDAVRAFLVEHTGMLVGRWDALVTQAEAELRRLT
jgi:hypothetical protein